MLGLHGDLGCRVRDVRNGEWGGHWEGRNVDTSNAGHCRHLNSKDPRSPGGGRWKRETGMTLKMVTMIEYPVGSRQCIWNFTDIS